MATLDLGLASMRAGVSPMAGWVAQRGGCGQVHGKELNSRGSERRAKMTAGLWSGKWM
jgi:hypothetical protein